ncbi:MAG: chitobiase/beta-hexosaminidase C-terminal domain-containing protein, partial [Bacteroidota bacterium]
AFAPGEGVTFPGGAGDLPMQVEGVSQTGNILQVTVTGATYEFNLTTNSLKAFQRIDAERLLTEVTTLPLSGLKVQSQNDQVVVLVGDNLTIGVQMDGVLVISPHQNMQATIESVLGGDFNRYSGGDLLSSDDFGGFTANIHMPKGTGLLPQMSMLTTGLDFPNFLPDDLASRGSAESGWKAQADLRPGERLFLSVFPTRPYDWAKSFDHNWGLSDYNATLDYDNPPYMKNWILWNINQRGWAMSFGERYEIRPNVPYQDHFDAITAEGDKWSAYFSQWFYYSRDPVEWVNEIKRWRDEYNMGAIYSDGLAQDDWLSAYEAMRRLREEVFPSGNIIIHDSYPQSGVASAGYRPFIYAYATSTYMGENAEAAGEDWAWARYAICQFRRGNSLGVIKGDQWAGFQSVQRYLLSLVWGGRGIPDVLDYESTYLPILNQLKTLWETYGNDPFFFDRYYHPEAQNLTGYNIGRAGMPILQLDTIRANEIRVTASTWTPSADLYYTIDGSEPTINSLAYTTPIIWDGQQNLRFRALRADLDESRIADLGERSNTPLPVELLRFVAIEEKGNARLNWQTALEINNEKFEIEHSLDGKNFQKIGKQTGQGNSVVTQHYTFTHEQPPGGLNYYRLKQIDFNGAANHSLIESVFIDAKGAFNYRVYPNPGSTFVRLEGNIEGQQVDLFDSKGQFIRSFQPSSTSLNISLEGLSSGLYLLKVTDRATHQHSWQRFLKD